MPRKYKPTERFLLPDPRYGNVLLSKFINCCMYSGQKSVAQREIYKALDIIKEKMPQEDPVNVFSTAIENVKPQVEVRSKRVGGATYQVPVEVGRKRQQSLAFRWILEFGRKARRGRPFHQSLAEELMAAFKREGAAWTQRENVHKMAEANKAFSHFAW
ncbi:MAG: 30S ribosomal protein S7 [Planctomycetes bacterium]|nr:30S ribosomal protein S7 [Planctomycetota bacterium]